MEILATLEPEPRGHLHRGDRAMCARTATRSSTSRSARRSSTGASGALSFGVGSGIVWDSERRRRVRRVPAEGRGARPAPPAFELLETLRWTPTTGSTCSTAISRGLRESAEYFGFAIRRAQRRTTRLDGPSQGADGAAAGPPAASTLHGGVRVEAHRRTFQAGPRASAAGAGRRSMPRRRVPVPQDDQPSVYDGRALRPDRRGAAVERGGEVTEATTANIVVELDGVPRDAAGRVRTAGRHVPRGAAGPRARSRERSSRSTNCGARPGSG